MHIFRYIFLIVIGIPYASFSQADNVYNALLVPKELKENANAVVRYENKTIEIEAIDKIIVQEKRIVTIFNKYGDKHSNVAQNYDGNIQIKKMEVVIYDALGKEVKKVRKGDFTDASAVSDFSIYEDDRVRYLNYIPLKYPYTVEYNLEVIYKSTAFFPNWSPIDSYFLGIQHSEYKILNTFNAELKSKKENFAGFEIEEKEEHHFIMKDVPGIKFEAYVPNINDYLPKYKVALKNFSLLGVEGVNNNWNDFGKWMHDRLLVGTDDIPQATIDEVKALTAGVDDKLERAKLVYKYMQNRTRYISIQVGIGGWKPMLAQEVDELGYGDCKGLTNYTKALLEAVDVPSYYTVVYGNKSLADIDNDFSSIQGNHVILTVPNNGEHIFLECTSQRNPFGFTAGFTDDRNVLLVKPDGGEIVRTTKYDTDDSMQKTTANVALDASGNIEADVKIVTTGYQYNIHEGLENSSSRDQLLHYKEYWDYINGLDVSDIKLKNDTDEIVYEEVVKISANNYASTSGDRLILQPNIFNRTESLPPRYSNRNFDFKIERGFKDIDEFVISYPKDLQLEAMSENKSVATPFGDYSFTIEKLEGHKLKYTRTYLLRKGSYKKEDYKAFRDFKRKVVRNDKSKIVLVKANSVDN